jgi:hypothetical protein
MKIVKAADGKDTVKISRKEWEIIGRKAGWIKKSQIIHNDGFADGGESYTDEEMDLMKVQKIKANANRPEKIKQILDLYVDMHPNASGYELNTLWSDIGQMSMEEINQYVDKYVSSWTREQA